MRQTTLGEYQDALPGRWLIFHGRGLFGPPRYACEEHRGDLVAYLREHYGAIGFQVWRRPPYPSSLAHSDIDNAWRRHQPPTEGSSPTARGSLSRPNPARAHADRGWGPVPARNIGVAKRHGTHECAGADPRPHRHTKRRRAPHRRRPSQYQLDFRPEQMFCVPVGPIRRPARGWPGLDSLGGASLPT